MNTCYTNFNVVEDYDHGDDTVERADTYREHSDPSNLGGDSREKVQGRTADEANETFYPHVVPGDVSIFKAAGLGTIAPLANWQDNDLPPEVSAQLGQAKERAFIPFGKQKGKSKCKGKFLVGLSCWPLENRRQRMEELKAKKPNAMFTVEKKNGHTIANTQCLHPVCLRKPRRIQLE